MGEPFIRGRNTTFKLYFNNQPFVVKVKTWSIEEIAVEVTDQVNGEQRARFDIVTDGFKLMTDCYDDSSSNILTNIIAQITAADAINPALPFSGGVLFQYNDGLTKGAFTMNGAVRTPMKVASGGRTEAIEHTVGARFTQFASAPAA
jgi:hypothetical protein